ncbi:MAG: DNA-processing protein DprA [Candidatus Woesearchaeota archaeon]|nr:DNA-processing protein DprA [Candidatus Woesearchaeota archaeon]
MTTYQSHFAYRNRLTVSLSKEGIVVVQADDESGTQHAIRHAHKQNKKIYALPNNFGKEYKWVEKYKPAKT